MGLLYLYFYFEEVSVHFSPFFGGKEPQCTFFSSVLKSVLILSWIGMEKSMTFLA